MAKSDKSDNKLLYAIITVLVIAVVILLLNRGNTNTQTSQTTSQTTTAQDFTINVYNYSATSHATNNPNITEVVKWSLFKWQANNTVIQPGESISDPISVFAYNIGSIRNGVGGQLSNVCNGGTCTGMSIYLNRTLESASCASGTEGPLNYSSTQNQYSQYGVMPAGVNACFSDIVCRIGQGCTGNYVPYQGNITIVSCLTNNTSECTQPIMINLS